MPFKYGKWPTHVSTARMAWMYKVCAVQRGVIMETIKEYDDWDRALARLRLIVNNNGADARNGWGDIFIIVAVRAEQQ